MKIISLGYSCAVALTLKKWGILSPANIFDNMITKRLDGVVDFIKCEGKDFFLEENVQWQIMKGYKTIWAYDIKHSFLSVHDVLLESTNKLKDLHLAKEKMKDRLFDILKAKNLLIIRNNKIDEKLESIVHLYDTILKLREERPFYLCILQNASFAEKDWGLPGLEIYRSNCAHYEDDKGDWITDGSWNTALTSILSKLNINFKQRQGEPFMNNHGPEAQNMLNYYFNDSS